jgi:hypothetical protein
VCGGTDVGVASVLVTPDDQWVLTSSVEGRRFQEEVLAHIWAGGVFRMGEYPWHCETAALINTADRVAGGGGRPGLSPRFGSDVPLDGAEFVGPELVRLRYPFTRGEAERYVGVGQGVARIVEHAAREVRPGQTERAIAGRVASDLIAAGYFPCSAACGSRLAGGAVQASSSHNEQSGEVLHDNRLCPPWRPDCRSYQISPHR